MEIIIKISQRDADRIAYIGSKPRGQTTPAERLEYDRLIALCATAVAMKIINREQKEVRGMNAILKAVVHDMNFNELRIALLAVIALTQTGDCLTFKELAEIIDESKRS